VEKLGHRGCVTGAAPCPGPLSVSATCSASSQTQNQRSQELWTEASDTVSQNKSFPEVVYVKYFITVVKNLTNTKL
jgi:hypothetical protein